MLHQAKLADAHQSYYLPILSTITPCRHGMPAFGQDSRI
jgi:hypothetical protein